MNGDDAKIEEFESIVCDNKMDIIRDFIKTHKFEDVWEEYQTDSIAFIKLLEIFVECGDGFAMFELGLMYDGESLYKFEPTQKHEKVVKQDYGKALKYYKMAIEKGNGYAACSLGHMYENGRGVNQNYVKALEYYMKALELDKDGCSESVNMYVLGMIPKLNHNDEISDKCECYKLLKDVDYDLEYLRKIECNMNDALRLYDENDTLRKENDALRKELDELKEHVKYMPYGEGYEEAKAEFKQLATKFVISK
jgi:TPR repeat protein